MQSPDQIRKGYDLAAEAYGEKLLDELDHKPMDRELLTQFADLFRNHEHLVLDVGCGTGQTTGFIANLGVNITGVDLSPGMITVAKRHFPEVSFEQGDLFKLDRADSSIDGIVAFYALVHVLPEQLPDALQEFARVLKPGGTALISFHIGEGQVHNDNFLESGAELTFYYHNMEDMENQLAVAGFSIDNQVVRPPYDSEYPSTRGYVLAKKP